MREDDFSPTTLGLFKRQSSLRPGDLPSIQEMKGKDPFVSTSNDSPLVKCDTQPHLHSVPEEAECQAVGSDLGKLSLFASFAPSHTRASLPIMNSSACVPLAQPHTSISDALSSNLTALVQSSQPVNPFSPYGYSMAAQAQSSSNAHHQQSSIFTPKRGTNPFDDDLIRR